MCVCVCVFLCLRVRVRVRVSVRVRGTSTLVTNRHIGTTRHFPIRVTLLVQGFTKLGQSFRSFMSGFATVLPNPTVFERCVRA